MFTSGFTVRLSDSLLPFHGCQCGRREALARSVGRALPRRGAAFSGCTGCCGFAHDSQLLPYGELFFLIKVEPTIHEKVVFSERDTEDGSTFSFEEGDHNVEKIMLCTSAHHACSPLLQNCFYEELCQAALTCHFFRWTSCTLCQE